MAKKAELLDRANELGLEVDEKSTIAELEAAIATAGAVEAETEVVKEERSNAKAGKRSDKSLREAEEKAEKEARKAAGDTSPIDGEEVRKKGPAPKIRSRLERRGKSYRSVAGNVEASKVYALAEALELAVKTNPSKFDASVEIHVKLGVDPRQADQNIRSTVSLPNGTGKSIRVAVFAPEAELAAAKSAGADVTGDDDFLKQLDKEELNFDVLVSTPQYMPKLGKYARLLGPRGLMPNPKSGTVATDVAKAVNEAKAGKVEYRVDKQAIIHLAVGKVSFGAEKLEQNARAFFDSLQSQKPSGLKNAYVRSTSISTTMGPGIRTENVVS